jgi:hypothetical protein
MRWMTGWRRTASCAALTLALLLAPVVSAASEPSGGGETESWKRVLQYSACAAGIVAAPTGWGIAVSVLTCTLLFTD